MSCNGCFTDPCCCGRPLPPACNCPPSPIPPWARATQSPLTQTLADNSVPLLLDPDITYLNAASPLVPPAIIPLVLPNGNFLKQIKRIYIPGNAVATSATWLITGTFAGGFTHLQFDRLGTSVWLEWDGSSWQLIGGNATLTP